MSPEINSSWSKAEMRGLPPEDKEWVAMRSRRNFLE